jgi:hypothetical protein
MLSQDNRVAAKVPQLIDLTCLLSTMGKKAASRSPQRASFGMQSGFTIASAETICATYMCHAWQ